MGATDNPARYAYLAVQRLKSHGHEVLAFGRHEGIVNGVQIKKELPEDKNIDTVTLYLNPTNQEPYLDYIINLHPKRIIYNPGTENPKLMEMAKKNGITNEIGCTLVMLSIGIY